MGTPLKVLLVEDSEDDALLVVRELKRGGYEPQSRRVETAEQMKAALDEQEWDAVISDYLVPGFGAPGALGVLEKRELDLPFIAVSGAVDEDIAATLMKAGAHDFIMKGNLARLVPAIQRELREAEVRGQKRQAEEDLRESFLKLGRVLEETVESLARAVEKRDPYTAGHQARVAELACAIAQKMGLPEDQITGLRLAGVIHDIGKLNVPVEVLTKPGKLSDAEFAIIKSHPQEGYEILKDIEFSWPVADATLQHHERLDGSGYPAGLSDDDILLEARILAVADVVEAMSSHRPYRPALGIEAALEEISQNKGTFFDPDAVDACLKVFEEGTFSLEG